MGLQKEIEELFHRVVELDLERIARSAEPSYHWTTTPMPSMFMYQSPGPGSVVLEPVDYQVVKIELNPFRVDDSDTGPLAKNMKTLKKRREKRLKKPTDFETAVIQKKWGEAYHHYIEESQAQNPIPILPRDIDISDAAHPKARIISVSGVDYIHTAHLANYADRTNSPIANVDQWPERVVLKRDGGEDEYLRADLIDAAGGPPDELKP